MIRQPFAIAVLCITLALQPCAAQSPTENDAVLNFVGADIDAVIKAIGHYTNTTFMVDSRVKGTLNLVSEKPVSKAQAFRLLASALRLQGYAVVAGPDFTKVVPEADAKLQASPSDINGVRGDQIATQIFRLNYESASNLATILRPMISPNNTINANPTSNTLVITDYAENLHRLAKIINTLDTPTNTDLDIVPIRYAVAADIALMVSRLLESGTANAEAGRVLLLVDARTNSVIVRAQSIARAELAKSLLARLDQPTAQPGNVHVVHLKNADAVKLAQTLRSVVMLDVNSNDNANNTASNSATSSASSPAATSSKSTASASNAANFIQADASTNALIITASEPVYRTLRVTIDQLDVRRAQVYVEVLIVEISSDKAAELGVQWAGLSGDANSSYRAGGLINFSDASSASNLGNVLSQAATPAATRTALQPANGLNFGIFRNINGRLTLGAVARALESNGNANILSMPNLITLDNEEARIVVGQNVPFVTGQYTTAASGGSTGVNPFQTIERKDVGLSLRVRPQISEGGAVKMALYQETSNVRATTNASDIITDKRSIETNVVVDDGQIIVLGGLIDDNGTNNTEKVPGLGDLPVLGGLFKYQKHTLVKRNLMVFLRPTVIRNSEHSASIAGDRYNYIRDVQLQEQTQSSSLLPNLATPVLPPLENQRIVGGPLYQKIEAPTPTPTPVRQ